VPVRVARVVPVRAHRTEPAVVAHAPVRNTSQNIIKRKIPSLRDKHCTA
jgi:hypothetical protein